jgi:PAS domain S-box-containing protein
MHVPRWDTWWERLFWLVFERSSNPISLVDDQRRFVEVNDAWLALLGRSREELVGASVNDNIRPSERPRAAQEWEAVQRLGEHTGTRALVRADGSEVEIDFAARLAVVGGRRLAIYVALTKRDPRPSSAGTRPSQRALSKREREVVTLIALGQETNQIAEALSISPETVRTHVGNAMSKLGAHTRAQLVAIALCTDEAISLPPVSLPHLGE